jgi:hypothetical protein
MIKTISLRTEEADDPEYAADEIVAQLDASCLLKYSVGIVSCLSDVIVSGVLKAVAEAVPFPVVGVTTISSAGGGVPDDASDLMLLITVLTSDDVEFVCGVTTPIVSEDPAPFKSAWEQATLGRTQKPALMLSFAPLLVSVSADFFAECWSGISGNTPNFGSLAVDHNPDYHDSQTILNGEAFPNSYVFVLCYGDFTPKFFMGGISRERALAEKAIITSSRGNQLKEVNGISVAEYLTSIGITKNAAGEIEGINSFPFIMDYNDGSAPVIRVMFAITPDGAAVCGGKTPEGAALMVGSITPEEIIRTSGEAFRQAAAAEGSCALIFSCVGRYFTLGFNPHEEMKLAAKLLAHVPYHFAYSGTELCPVYSKDGSISNRSHNDTIIICVFG